MVHESFFLAIASVALGLIGFFSIVSVIRNQGALTSQEEAGLRLIYHHVFAAISFALLPFLWGAWFASTANAWRWSSFCMAIFLVYEFAINYLAVAKLIKAGTKPRRLRGLHVHFLPLTALVSALLFVDASGKSPLGGSEVMYMWGLFWLLNPPAIQFYHFMLPPKTSAAENFVAPSPGDMVAKT